MKKIFYLISLAIILASCAKSSDNSAYTPDCSGTAKTFSKDANPVISNSCSGCHSQYSTYSQIVASKASIRSTIVDGTMPKGATLTAAQKNAVVCWIDNGTPNN